MKKSLLALPFLLCLFGGLFSQARYTLQLPGETALFPANFEQFQTARQRLLTAEEQANGQGYRILQFLEIPTPEEKAQLAQLGIELKLYVRNYAWLVALPKRIQPADLAPFAVRGIYTLAEKNKLSKALRRAEHPSHALTGTDRVRLLAYPFSEVSTNFLNNKDESRRRFKTAFYQRLQALEGRLLDADLYFPVAFGIEIPLNQIPALAQVPELYYLEHFPGPPQPEREPSRHTARSNILLNDFPGGLQLDGSGIVTGVSEGLLDTNQIDFKGRNDGSYHTGTNYSGHAFGVSQRICGAGNEDPLHRGMAPGTHHLTISYAAWNQPNLYTTENLRVVNHSYGYSCFQEYTGNSVLIDNQIRSQASMMHVFSAGNSGNSSSCDAYGLLGWGNITGGHKQAKNGIATASVNDNDVITGFSSRGPAYDGRVKPDLAATGPGGTSHAAPCVTGVIAQLYQGYKLLNNGQEAESGLIKGILQNTADDLGNPGPDFLYGYGRINARRAYDVIAAGNFQTATIGNGDSMSISLNVPAGTQQIRVMLYWSDYEATAGAPAALVNDLDLRLVDPNATTHLPWVLDTAANPSSLNKSAVPGRDSLNNMEQVTLNNPPAGTFQAIIDGRLVPQGPQKFYLIYEFVPETLLLTHPYGGETWVPGETQLIKWDAYGGTGTFSLEMSADSGQTWSSISNSIPAGQGYFNYTVPDTISGQCFLRINRGSASSTSQAPFSIIDVPQNLSILWVCADSAMIAWDSVAGASAYEVYRLGPKYMDPQGIVSGNTFIFNGLSTTESEWFSVRALGPLNAAGRRAVALERVPGDFNCVPFDASLDDASLIEAGFIPDCIAGQKLPLNIQVSSVGTTALNGIPVNYQVDNGTIFSGTISNPLSPNQSSNYTFPDSLTLSGPGVYTITYWINYPGDANASNDTLRAIVEVYASGTVAPSYTQDFDQFTDCSTAWGCDAIVCPLSQDWFNVPNIPGIGHDSIDFRTLSGATGSGGTGPSADHTSGNGKYLYLEGSGNNGSGCQNKEAQLHSPCLDLRGTNQPKLSFWYHMYGNSIGSLAVDVFSNGIWVEDVIPPIVGDQGDNWFQTEVDLSAFTDEIIVVRFRGRTGNGWSADLAIDDVNLESLPRMDFEADRVLSCPGDTISFTDLSSFSNNWQWEISPASFSFVNGTNANSQHPQIVVQAPGMYSVTLSGSNANGADTLVRTAYINAGPYALSLLSSDADSSICQGDPVDFTAFHPDATQYSFFVDGNPVQSGSNNVFSTTSLSDGQVVSAFASIGNNCTTDTKAFGFSVQARPVAAATVDTSACPVLAFTDLSTGDSISSWTWDFGDNINSTLQNPVHDYAAAGNGSYTVSLITGNHCGTDTTFISVDISCLLGVFGPGYSLESIVYPNPSSDQIFIEFQGDGLHPALLDLTDLHGKSVLTHQVPASFDWTKAKLDLSNLSRGVYLLELQMGPARSLHKVTLQQ